MLANGLDWLPHLLYIVFSMLRVMFRLQLATSADHQACCALWVSQRSQLCALLSSQLLANSQTPTSLHDEYRLGLVHFHKC